MTPRPARLRRGLSTGAAASALVLVPLGAATAADEPLSIENLPSIATDEVNERRVAITIPDIRGIDVPDIQPFVPEVTSDGDETVVSLDTDVLFEFGKAELSAEAKKAVVDAVRDVPDDAAIEVVGHTDSIGSDADNLALSKKRAQAAATAITAERDDLTTKVSGKGESDPVAPNTQGDEDNPEGREKNRRVEIRYAD